MTRKHSGKAPDRKPAERKSAAAPQMGGQSDSAGVQAQQSGEVSRDHPGQVPPKPGRITDWASI